MDEKSLDKPGWKTTEALAAVLALVLPYLKELSDVKFVAVCVVLAVYIAGRSWKKGKRAAAPAGAP